MRGQQAPRRARKREKPADSLIFHLTLLSPALLLSVGGLGAHTATLDQSCGVLLW